MMLKYVFVVGSVYTKAK